MTTLENHSADLAGAFAPLFRIKDKWSARTHFWGLLFAIIGTPVLLIRASGCPLLLQIGFAVFMLSMCMLYGASTAYHTFDIGKNGNLKLKRLDHCSIFWLIAGSYTPICLQVLPQKQCMILLGVVYGLALTGTVFKLLWVTCPRYVSSVIYIAMGWACISVIGDLVAGMRTGAFLLLLAGGLFYTAGGVIYAIRKPLLKSEEFRNHELFHCFVLAGSFCHYMLMLIYLTA